MTIWRFPDRTSLELFNLASTPCWIFDVAAHAMWWANRAALTLWQAESLEELLARDFSTDSPTVRKRLRQVLDHATPGQPVRDRWTIYPRGKPVSVQLALTPLRIGEPEHEGILLEALTSAPSDSDLEDRRLIETVRYTAIMISHFTLDGALVAMNPAAIQAYGTLPAEMGQTGHTSTLHARFPTQELATQLLARCIAGEEPQGDFQVRTAQGLRWHKITLHLGRDTLKGASVAIVVEEDITSLKQAVLALERLNETLEEKVQLRTSDLKAATRRAEQANIAKSDFLARMSHDLRTPLNAILGFSEILTTPRLADVAARNFPRYGANIHGAANSLLGLVNDLLDLSSIEAGRYPIHIEMVEPKAVVHEALRLVLPGFAERRVDIERATDTPDHIWTDRRALVLILNNLISNALKFTTADNRVIVRLYPMSDGKQCRIEVEDDGPGIAPEDLETVFDPYFRGNAMIARLAPGTGLGLSICRELAKQLDMDLTIHSNGYCGTTVKLTLPERVDRARQSSAASTPT